MQRTILNFEASSILSHGTLFAAVFGAAAYVVRSYKIKFIEQAKGIKLRDDLITTLEAQVTNRDQMVNALEKEGANKEETIKTLKELVAANNAEIEVLKIKNQSLEETVTHLNSEMNELRNENADLKKNLHTLEETISDLKQDMAEFRKLITETKQADIDLEPAPYEVYQPDSTEISTDASSPLGRSLYSNFQSFLTNSLFSPINNREEKDEPIQTMEKEYDNESMMEKREESVSLNSRM